MQDAKCTAAICRQTCAAWGLAGELSGAKRAFGILKQPSATDLWANESERGDEFGQLDLKCAITKKKKREASV